jgi:septum formation protein
MLILASQSPRRQELLKTIYPHPFEVLPSHADEESVKASSLEELPEAISFVKGHDISLSHLEDFVIAADTIVIFQNQKFGKPKDREDAVRMLKALNEKEHEVVTGYHIFKGGRALVSASSFTYLTLHGLSDKKIEEYIATGSPFDKAGAYGIQDEDFISCTIRKGSYTNVMGFPTEDIHSALKKLKII